VLEKADGLKLVQGIGRCVAEPASQVENQLRKRVPIYIRE
jgi:hypothetical protein